VKYFDACVKVFMQSIHYSCQILKKLEFSRNIFEKINIKFHVNPSSGRRVVPDGQTHTTKIIVAFCNFANTPTNRLI